MLRALLWSVSAPNGDTDMPASTDLDTNVRHRHPSSFGPTLLRGSLEDVRALQVRWRSEHVIIEYANAGQPLASELRRENAQWSSRLIPYRPRVEKAVRFAAQTAKIEEGKILRPAEAPWLAALRQELQAFPRGRHDDQADALAQFLDWSAWPQAQSVIWTARNGGRTMRRDIPRR